MATATAVVSECSNPSSNCVTVKEEDKKHFGEAVYVVGRVKKNRILIYKSHVHPDRVYEFCLVRVFSRPIGFATWMCSHCSVIKQRSRKQGNPINKKCPRILVDNDFIREDPDNPIHPHFCEGKDAIRAATARARIQVVQECEAAVEADAACSSRATVRRLLETPESEEFNFLAPSQRQHLKRVLIEEYPSVQRRVDQLIRVRSEAKHNHSKMARKETSDRSAAVSASDDASDLNVSIDSQTSEETEEITAPRSVEEIIGPFEDDEPIVVEVAPYEDEEEDHDQEQELIQEHYESERLRPGATYANDHIRVIRRFQPNYEDSDDEIIDVEQLDLD